MFPDNYDAAYQEFNEIGMTIVDGWDALRLRFRLRIEKIDYTCTFLNGIGMYHIERVC